MLLTLNTGVKALGPSKLAWDYPQTTLPARAAKTSSSHPVRKGVLGLTAVPSRQEGVHSQHNAASCSENPA
eukprot:1181272-Prorocentrum_minimum.AAC.2